MIRPIRVSSRAAAALVLAVALLAAGLTAASPAEAAPGAPHPQVDGARLVDARTGRTWVPHGVNWPSFEYACWQGWGYSQSTSAAEAQLIASWGVDLVRLPLNQDCWLGLNGAPAGGGRTAAGYRSAVESWVDQLHLAGVAVILDLHITAPAGVAARGQRAMPDAQSVTAWASIAARFADDPSVMFDLFNEPYSRWAPSGGGLAFSLSWGCWRDGGCHPPVEDDAAGALSGASYAAVGMSELLAAVRSAGAGQPALLAGIDYANDLNGWLSHRPHDDQLVVSWHAYPGQSCRTIGCWDATVAPIADQVPVIVTEFGQTDGGSDYLARLMDWSDEHGIGYLPWAWWRVDASESLSNSRYALVDDDGRPKAPAGTLFHDHLRELGGGRQVDRVSGADRYAAAVGVSRAANPGAASAVYVASGEKFPDALSAAPVAARDHSPLLLTAGGFLPAVVRAEIARLEPDRIVVVGGPASVSDTVLAQLAAIQPRVERIAGADRYAASAAIARAAFDGIHPDTVFVATGENFPDALTAGAAAGAAGAPVLLVPGSASELGPDTRAALSALDPHSIVVVGGPASVSDAVMGALGAFAPVTRIAGADRFAVGVGVARFAFGSSDRAILATGLGFPDALAASAWAGTIGAPLYVVPGTCVTRDVLADLDRLGATRVTLVGGPVSLAPSVETLTPC
ncbi:MAG: cell wall-binding repeat-containing protein [Micrococcales bacterium]|nr:cell wall-binding repeat-containing protein [Micrococcales bacterium]OJX66112.1 MAG: hypothetical protein BGO94_04095 [Micrococcales bacterium 72-143]